LAWEKATGKGDVVQNSTELSPWLIKNPNDPKPKQPWYISARYFARQLVKKDSTLLTKRTLLAQKVVTSLNKVGIKKGAELIPLALERY